MDLLIAGGFGGETFEWKTLYVRNDGDAGFTVANPGMIAGDSVVWADIDNDGDAGAIVSASDQILNSSVQTVVYRNDGTGNFTAFAQSLPAAKSGALAVADFDNDGRVDLCIGNSSGTAVWLNQGDGSFVKRPAGLPALHAYDDSAIRAADVNGDHRIDLIVSGIAGEGATRVYLNDDKPLRFTPTPDTLPTVGQPAVALADIDADGDLDLAISGCEGNRQTRLFLNDGAGGFTDSEALLPHLRDGALAWADVNADGRPELLATGREEDVYGGPYPDRYYKNETFVLSQTPDGGFESFAPPLPDVSRGVANIADLDGDNNPDLLVAGTLADINESAADKLTAGVYLHGETVPGWINGNTPPATHGACQARRALVLRRGRCTRRPKGESGAGGRALYKVPGGRIGRGGAAPCTKYPAGESGAGGRALYKVPGGALDAGVVGPNTRSSAEAATVPSSASFGTTAPDSDIAGGSWHWLTSRCVQSYSSAEKAEPRLKF